MWSFFYALLLAHLSLSRRLIGELIVYAGIQHPSGDRRLSVCLSVKFSNDFSSEAVRPILFIFHI